MPKFYVKNDEGLWNIYSTIIDDYVLPDFMDISMIITYAIGEEVINKLSDLESLETDRPRLNVMSYEEAEQRRAEIRGIEEIEEE